MLFLCQVGGDNFRVSRRIYKFSLQKKYIQGSCDQLLKSRSLIRKKSSMTKEAQASLSVTWNFLLHLPSCIKTPYFCWGGARRNRFERSCSLLSLWTSRINPSLSSGTSFSMFCLTSTLGTQTWILGGGDPATLLFPHFYQITSFSAINMKAGHHLFIIFHQSVLLSLLSFTFIMLSFPYS